MLWAAQVSPEDSGAVGTAGARERELPLVLPGHGGAGRTLPPNSTGQGCGGEESSVSPERRWNRGRGWWLSGLWLPGDHLQGFPGESRECQPWVSLKSDLGFPKGGFALNQEMQNYPWPQQHLRSGDYCRCLGGVCVKAKKQDQVQSEMVAREGRDTDMDRRAGLGGGQETDFW